MADGADLGMANLPRANQTWRLWKQKGRRTDWVRRVPTAVQLWESPSPMGSPRAESTGQRSPASSRKGLVLSPPLCCLSEGVKSLREQEASVWILMQVQRYSDWGLPVNYIPYSKSSLRDSDGCTSRATRGLNKHINIQVLKVTMTLT